MGKGLVSSSGLKLLSVSSDGKTTKGEAYGYCTAILYLAAANDAGFGNVCPFATKGCMEGCLKDAGRIEMEGENGVIQTARNRRTEMFFKHRMEFFALLRTEIKVVIRRAQAKHLIPVFRLNGTSDMPILALTMAREFPDVQFYDYTKIPISKHDPRATLPNYHLTFSRSESNESTCLEMLARGYNVAVPFDILKGRDLPSHYLGYHVIDGDVSDLRFKDVGQRIVGLRSKGGAHRKAQSLNNNPFIVKVA